MAYYHYNQPKEYPFAGYSFVAVYVTLPVPAGVPSNFLNSLVIDPVRVMELTSKIPFKES